MYRSRALIIFQQEEWNGRVEIELFEEFENPVSEVKNPTLFEQEGARNNGIES